MRQIGKGIRDVTCCGCLQVFHCQCLVGLHMITVHVRLAQHEGAIAFPGIRGLFQKTDEMFRITADFLFRHDKCFGCIEDRHRPVHEVIDSPDLISEGRICGRE